MSGQQKDNIYKKLFLPLYAVIVSLLVLPAPAAYIYNSTHTISCPLLLLVHRVSTARQPDFSLTSPVGRAPLRLCGVSNLHEPVRKTDGVIVRF